MKTLVVTVLDDAAEAKLRELVAQSAGLSFENVEHSDGDWIDVPLESRQAIIRGLEQINRGESLPWEEVYAKHFKWAQEKRK